MTHKPFDLEKAMRNGGKCLYVGRNAPNRCPARVICTNKKNRYGKETLVALIDAGHYEYEYESPLDIADLINIPEKKTGWIAHWPMHATNSRASTNIYDTKEEAQIASEGYSALNAVIQQIEWDE